MESKDEDDGASSNDGYTSDVITSGSDNDDSYPEGNSLDDINNQSLGMGKYKMFAFFFFFWMIQ